MQKFGIAGWQNSGKTTLVKNLIPTFAKKGLTVSTIKHAHHNFDIDKPALIQSLIIQTSYILVFNIIGLWNFNRKDILT